jgi:hypothetical protein
MIKNVREAKMRSPFPGMDPYLERPSLWHEVHTGLIVALQLHLAPLLPSHYRVAIEQRTYSSPPAPDDLVGLPDVSVLREKTDVAYASAPSTTASVVTPVVVRVPMPEEQRERYLEVRDTQSGVVITVIELVSPSNKRAGEGRREYEQKRMRVLGSLAHLVEVDLLRGGEPMPMRVQDNSRTGHYRILVSRADRRPNADLYLFTVRNTIPTFPLPLQRGDTEPTVDLGKLLHDLHERAHYERAIDYRQDPTPPLDADDAAWADDLLRRAGLR